MIARVLKVKGVELSVSIDERYARSLRSVKKAMRGGSRALAVQATTAAVRPASAAVAEPPAAAALRKQVESVEWYHTIDLPHGIVTPGFFDHRPLMAHYHLPDSLGGLRALDVATFDGYWAFEFERRGAAEVVAADIEKFGDTDYSPARRASMTREQLETPVGRGFAIASAALGSKVRREIVSVYDLSPDRLGLFDIVNCGDLLLHLTNPIRALQRIRTVTRGYAMISDMYDPYLDRRNPRGAMHYRGGTTDSVWWTFSLTGLEQMIKDAGFSKVTLIDRFDLLPRLQGDIAGAPPHVVFRADA